LVEGIDRLLAAILQSRKMPAYIDQETEPEIALFRQRFARVDQATV
jgi:hypothetical protein